MHLPINITDLLQGNIVESDRIEFKADWNPVKILHTICAFANDFNNYGGGYIVLGVEEQDGKPSYPPRGIDPNRLDKLQKDLLNLCSYLKPSYTPIASMESYQGKDVFVIWAPGGQARPYLAPASLGKNESKEHHYYIRKFSNSVIAKNDELKDRRCAFP